MTKRWKTRARLAALAMAIASTAAGGQKAEEPFFHQFLAPGDPFDEKLLAQEKLVAENPNSAPLRNDFGNLLTERRFAKEARAEYEKALSLDPKFFVAAYNLGLMEETEGRFSAAMSAYREAIDRRRGFPPAHFRLGRLYEKSGRVDDAVQEYAKALRIDDSMRDPRRNPLVVDSRLIDQASLVNYSRDVARATLAPELEYVDTARFRPVPVDRTLDAAEVDEQAGPQTIDTRATVPASGNRAPPVAAPGRAPTTRPPRPARREIAPRPAEVPPPPTPGPAENVPPPPPQPEPEPEPER